MLPAAGYRLHAGLVEQDAVDGDTGKVRSRTVSGHRGPAHDVGASRGQQGRNTQHQASRHHCQPLSLVASLIAEPSPSLGVPGTQSNTVVR